MNGPAAPRAPWPEDSAAACPDSDKPCIGTVYSPDRGQFFTYARLRAVSHYPSVSDGRLQTLSAPRTGTNSRRCYVQPALRGTMVSV